MANSSDKGNQAQVDSIKAIGEVTWHWRISIIDADAQTKAHLIQAWKEEILEARPPF